MAKMSSVDKCIGFAEELEDMVENAAAVPLVRNRIMLDREEVLDLLGQLKHNLPREVKEGRSIIETKDRIIQEAEREASSIVLEAERKSKYMIDNSEIVRQANKKAEEIITNATGRSRELFNNVKAYCDSIFKSTDDELSKMLEKTRKSKVLLKNMAYTDFDKKMYDDDQN